MPVLSVRDYLQTQGLALSEEEVRIGVLAARAVMDGGRAGIERSVLWYGGKDGALSDHLAQTPENEALLKQVFMVLDSVCSRIAAVQSAAVYVLMPSENRPFLLRLAQQGRALAPLLALNEENGSQHLPVRTAQTGWLNLAGDVAHWLETGALAGSHNRRSQSQMSLPVCTESGRVLGVLHTEHGAAGALSEAAQAEWVALALALAAPLAALLQSECREKQEHREEAND